MFDVGERPYPCELCGDWFATAAERTSHMKQHDADLCAVCKVRLRRWTSTSGSGGPSTGSDVSQTMCSVCYLDQLCTRDAIQVIVTTFLSPCVHLKKNFLVCFCFSQTLMSSLFEHKNCKLIFIIRFNMLLLMVFLRAMECFAHLSHGLGVRLSVRYTAVLYQNNVS